MIVRSLQATYIVTSEQNPFGILMSEPNKTRKWVVEKIDGISPGLLRTLYGHCTLCQLLGLSQMLKWSTTLHESKSMLPPFNASSDPEIRALSRSQSNQNLCTIRHRLARKPGEDAQTYLHFKKRIQLFLLFSHCKICLAKLSTKHE